MPRMPSRWVSFRLGYLRFRSITFCDTFNLKLLSPLLEVVVALLWTALTLKQKDGAIGKQFQADGSIGKQGEKVGGPFSSQGAVGKE